MAQSQSVGLSVEPAKRQNLFEACMTLSGKGEGAVAKELWPPALLQLEPLRVEVASDGQVQVTLHENRLGWAGLELKPDPQQDTGWILQWRDFDGARDYWPE